MAGAECALSREVGAFAESGESLRCLVPVRPQCYGSLEVLPRLGDAIACGQDQPHVELHLRDVSVFGHRQLGLQERRVTAAGTGQCNRQVNSYGGSGSAPPCSTRSSLGSTSAKLVETFPITTRPSGRLGL